MPEPIQALPIRAATPFSVHAARAAEAARRAAQAASGPRGMAGIPSGIAALDDALGGFQSGLHFLAAEPGSGKTAFALHVARAAAARWRLPVLYHSVDEAPERLAAKLLGAAASMSGVAALSGRSDLERFELAVAEHRESFATLAISGAEERLTVADLRDQLADMLREFDADTGLLVVDYLQPFAAALADGAREFRLAIGQVAQSLRKVALELGVAVLVVSAQSRSGQNTNKMQSLRESSDLEYSADSVALLQRDDNALVGAGRYGLICTLAKNRYGPSGQEIKLVLDGRTQRVIESSK